MKTWGIDLAALRREVLAETKGLPIKKELEKVDKEIINQLPKLFESIKSIDVNELAEILEVNPRTLTKVIFGYREELLKKNLDLVYEKGFIYKKN